MSRARRACPPLPWLAIAFLAGLLACSRPSASESAPAGWVEIRDQRIAVEIAETPEEQALGLGERDTLAWDHGMYFPYAKPAYYSFWMKGMRFSIDIVWLHDGRIIDISPNIPYQREGNGPTVRPKRPADAVLEVPAGYATAKGWRVGDRVAFERVEAR